MTRFASHTVGRRAKGHNWHVLGIRYLCSYVYKVLIFSVIYNYSCLITVYEFPTIYSYSKKASYAYKISRSTSGGLSVLDSRIIVYKKTTTLGKININNQSILNR